MDTTTGIAVRAEKKIVPVEDGFGAQLLLENLQGRQAPLSSPAEAIKIDITFNLHRTKSSK